MNKKASQSYNWVYAVALLLSVGLVVFGIVQAGNWMPLAAGCVSMAAILASWPLSAQLRAYHIASDEQAERALTTLNERFEQFSVMLNLLSEQQLLSDRAKSIAFREKDSDALRRAIQDEILKQNWEVAASLANEFENEFGYKQEADQLRQEIEHRRQDVVRKQLTDVVGVIDRHIKGEAWEEALQEAQSAARRFHDVPQAAALPQEVEKRREGHKAQLIASWNDAVNRHDVDGAIEILKRLDGYLSPTEAEAYQETARGIFKEKLNILKTQFSTAVHEQNWNDAITFADIIMRDFPNTQMAREMRDMMDSLRARAAGLQPASV